MVAPSTVLMELRERVLARNPERRPKWGFRLGPDLVIGLQPQKRGSSEFEGRAVLIVNGDVPTDAFQVPEKESAAQHAPTRRTLNFAPFTYGNKVGVEWEVEVFSGHWSRALHLPWDRVQKLVLHCLASVFNSGRFETLDPALMLLSRCACAAGRR